MRNPHEYSFLLEIILVLFTYSPLFICVHNSLSEPIISRNAILFKTRVQYRRPDNFAKKSCTCK
ncbi:hypothetical protein BT96DRAFT_718547 [Gymnopus androsaceus JB14]|uniref:Uncharacterized protein n=1 Tax=Gymnopus androsaceus JB14 TaxID=1447944 RepID=A0A6A4GE78_9AGAR|nr:hypothetical protein BT96DRAFT_718547 [Gymnopus androsaceus JB14]